MSVLVNKDTRVVTQGITGATGQLHTRACRDYGTQMVAGVTPGKGGSDFEGIPIFDTVAKAVADSVGAGVIPQSQAEDLVIVCGVFIHPAAADDKKIYQYNYDATKMAIANAMGSKPSAAEMLAGKDKAEHPFRGF